MRIFERLRAAVADFRRSHRSKLKIREQRQQIEDGVFSDNSTFDNGRFASDFEECTLMLRTKLNNSFPDNYHAKLQIGFNSNYNYSLKRSNAIDTSSAAIASALRNGATISQAVASGSKSIGL